MRALKATENYRVDKSPRGYRITCKVRGCQPKSKVVSESIWRQLKDMTAASFDGSICLELGVGVWKGGRR